MRRKEWKRSWEEVGPLLSLRAQHHHSRTIRSVLRQDGHGIKGVSTETSHGEAALGSRQMFWPSFIYYYFRTYLCIWLHPVLVAANAIFSCGTWDVQLRHMRSLVAAHVIFQLRHMGSSVAPHVIFSCVLRTFKLWHVGSSSPTRDQTWFPCTGSLEP